MAARRLSIAQTSTTTFADLGVPARLCAALSDTGITAPFPIQTATLPDSLAGRDVLGRGRTGSGKTYAFVLPVLARLAASPARCRPGRPRALILVPTRELATQIHAAMAPLAEALGLQTLTVFGGVSPARQIAGLRAGVDVVVACPGRLEDHVSTGHVRLDAIEVTVLDEADHMADLGFLPAVRRLLAKTPRQGQRLFFSATLDGEVDVLVRQFLTSPVAHNVDPVRSTVPATSHHVLHLRPDDRLAVLVDLAAAPGRTLMFTRTKRGAKTLTRQLIAAGVPAVELHGNLAQNARTRNLLAFSDGEAKTLVATDIAARGIHVDNISLVIHADPPLEHKAYLHRSGRTARAGASGTVVTLVTDDQIYEVRDLTRRAGITPTTTRLRPGHPLLGELAPGTRTFTAPKANEHTPGPPRPARQAGQPKPRPHTKQPNRSASSASSPRSGGGAAPAQPGRPSGAAAFSAGTRLGSRHRGR
jgi:superfamily II DNA/RNA helicase